MYKILSAVCARSSWMSKCLCINLCISVLCGQQCQTFLQTRPHRRHGDRAPRDIHTQHVDMNTPQAVPCVLGWSLTTYLKTLSIGAKTTRSNIAPSMLNAPLLPDSIYLPFFSLINMEMSRSLLLVEKKAVMSLVTDSMDVFGLQGLLFSESMSYLCLGSESKM